MSLSGILCGGHNMSKWSTYANQQEYDEGSALSGCVAIGPQGTH